jgi:hypothetical protein
MCHVPAIRFLGIYPHFILQETTFYGIKYLSEGSSVLLLLWLFLVLSFHYWFRDLLRELYKKYEILLIIFFLVFLLFLVSEGLLFVSFFWTSFHSLSSPTLGTWPGEGFYLPDPCELTFANTLLLSNAAISLGNAFISLEISSESLDSYETSKVPRIGGHFHGYIFILWTINR